MMKQYRRKPVFSVVALVMALLVLPSIAAEVTDQRRDPSSRPADTAKPLKVFILAGQSNMEGHAQVRTFDYKARDPKTPRLDQMAAEGIQFLDAHSPSTICSPSRYGLFSGQLVCRTGRDSTAFEGPGGPSYLAPGQLTIAEMLWKYLDHMGSGGNNYSNGILMEYALPETAPDATGQLFNLAEDPGETTNLFFAESARRKQMQALLKKLTSPKNGRSAAGLLG
jgi:hypothetical protein